MFSEAVHGIRTPWPCSNGSQGTPLRPGLSPDIPCPEHMNKCSYSLVCVHPQRHLPFTLQRGGSLQMAFLRQQMCRIELTSTF